MHLLERHYNERFKSLRDTWLPDWQQRRNLLNNKPLVFEVSWYLFFGCCFI